MKQISMKSLNLQRGFTAIETMVVLIVSIGAMSIGASYLSTYSDNLVNQSASVHAKAVADAAVEYIKDNNAAVAAVATPTTPASITIAMLQSTNYLSNSLTAQSPYGQSYSIKVLEPTPGKLETLIVTTGGDTIAELNLRRTAQLIGAIGGYVSSTNTAVAQGSYGGWSVSLASYGVTPGAGHLALALFFQDGSLVSDYVYRSAVSGHPELNTMNTPLIMAATQTLNSACSTTGAIAQDGNGAVLSCQGGTWQQQGSAYWKDPVDNMTALNAITCNATTSTWQTRIVKTPAVPAVGGGPRAYTCNGVSWKALVLDDNGDITIFGTATINKLAGNLEITSTAVEGTACSPNKRIASDATGLILSCQSSVWKRATLGAFKSLALSDTAVFDTQCDYILDGMRVAYISASQIMVVNNTISGPTTATWFLVNYNAKGIRYLAQDNYNNYTYYGAQAVGSIFYRC